MKRVIVLSGVLAVGLGLLTGAGCRFLPGYAGTKELRIQRVKGNLYVIGGSSPSDGGVFTGGNTGVFVTDAGVIVVDTKLGAWGGMLLEQIKTVTNKPVIMIINTHSHADHTGGNGAFPETVDIVAHESARANMQRMDAFGGAKSKLLPKRTFRDTLTIGEGADRVDLYYFGRGHTNGDSWVVFPALGVMQTGDMFSAQDAPAIDRQNGGSALEYGATLDNALATVKNVDTLIVGHSPLRTFSELQEYRRFVADFVGAVRAAKAEGKDVDEAASAVHLHDKYPGYRNNLYASAVRAIYDELDENAVAAK